MLSDNHRPSRQRRIASSALVGILVTGLTLIAGAAFTSSTAAADDSSAITVTAAEQDADVAHSPLPDLKLTVSQTEGLVSQAIQLSWTGGKPSTLPSQQNGGANFLQFAQCWGDDAQPDRTKCQYGAFLTPGATRDANRSDGSVAPEDAQYTIPGSGFSSPTKTAIPFHGADGGVVASVIDGAANPDQTAGETVNTNHYFSQYTSNEINFAGSGDNGSGSAKFEVQTLVQSNGLGCGTAITAKDGTVTGSSCWLVAIPRGTADVGETSITKSGLFWDAWKHRLAVRLKFRPVGLHCAIGTAERQVAGSELLAAAVASWQPALCSSKGGAAYSILTGTESDAAAAANGTSTAALALTSRALTGDIDDNLAYAPVGLAGVSIAFAIDRQPKADGTVPQAALDRARLPLQSMNLTPRLVAKLLTSSYLDSLPYSADRSHLMHIVQGKVVQNPRNILFDPDFLAINDKEWAYQAIANPGIADALVPQGRSDAAYALWNYVMADADARAFLAGTPDKWGMIVNPYSSTSASAAAGEGQVYPTDSFPKSDPTELAAEGTIPAVNVVTWRPFTNDLDTSAYLTLRGDGQVLSGWNPNASPPKFEKTPRNLPGSQAVIGVTDTSSAAKYQTVTAALLNPAGKFVLPTSDALTAAAAAMTASTKQSQVYGLDLSSDASKGATTAYPLALPIYAAVNPGMTDDAVRASYAAFIRYAVSTGAQTPGLDIGELPPGYAPVPAGWRTQALAAADRIQQGVPAAATADADSAGSGFASASGGTSSGSAVDGSGAAADPAATGALAGALAASKTPADPQLAGVQSALPLSLLAGLIGALATTVVSRIRRRT